MAPIRSERQKKPYAVSFYSVAGVSCLIHRCPQRPRGSDGHWVHDRAPLQTAKANAPANTSSTTKLIVSNLHYEITPKDLVVGILCCSWLESALHPLSVHFRTNRHARPRAFDQGTMIPNSKTPHHLLPGFLFRSHGPDNACG